MLLLLGMLVLLFYWKKGGEEELDADARDPGPHAKDGHAFENPQYSAGDEHSGDSAAGAGYLDVSAEGDEVCEAGPNRAAVNGSYEGNGALLYAVPMAEGNDDVAAGAGTINLPGGKAGTVVAVAASGACEVVVATDGIYAPAAAVGVEVVSTYDNTDYGPDGAGVGAGTGTRMGTSSTLNQAVAAGGGGSNDTYDHIGTGSASSDQVYDHIQRNVTNGSTLYSVPTAALSTAQDAQDEAGYTIPDSSMHVGGGSGGYATAEAYMPVPGAQSNEDVYAVPFDGESAQQERVDLDSDGYVANTSVNEDFC